MKQKVINLKGDKKDQFIRLIARQFNVTAEAEIKLLTLLINKEMFNPFYLDKILKHRLIKESDIPKNTFITCMNRLIKSGCIARNEKSYFLSVAFKDLDKMDFISFRCG
jgi:hypothetical protein